MTAPMPRKPNARIFDFRREITDWRLSIYRNIDDDSARALYFNTMAVDWMLAPAPTQPASPPGHTP